MFASNIATSKTTDNEKTVQKRRDYHGTVLDSWSHDSK